MKDPLKVKLKSKLYGFGNSEVIIDGKNYTSYVKKFEVCVSADDMTVLKIEFINIDVEGEFEGALINV